MTYIRRKQCVRESGRYTGLFLRAPFRHGDLYIYTRGKRDVSKSPIPKNRLTLFFEPQTPLSSMPAAFMAAMGHGPPGMMTMPMGGPPLAPPPGM